MKEPQPEEQASFSMISVMILSLCEGTSVLASDVQDQVNLRIKKRGCKMRHCFHFTYILRRAALRNASPYPTVVLAIMAVSGNGCRGPTIFLYDSRELPALLA